MSITCTWNSTTTKSTDWSNLGTDFCLCFLPACQSQWAFSKFQPLRLILGDGELKIQNVPAAAIRQAGHKLFIFIVKTSQLPWSVWPDMATPALYYLHTCKAAFQRKTEGSTPSSKPHLSLHKHSIWLPGVMHNDWVWFSMKWFNLPHLLQLLFLIISELVALLILKVLFGHHLYELVTLPILVLLGHHLYELVTLPILMVLLGIHQSFTPFPSFNLYGKHGAHSLHFLYA